MSAIGSFRSLGEGRTSSTLGAACNVLCTVVGTGLLNLPYTAAQSGWIGLPMLMVLGIMACYTADILIRTLDLINSNRAVFFGEDKLMGDHDGHSDNPAPSALAQRECESYGDIGEAAFGPIGRHLVNVQMHLTLVMVGCVYNLLGGLNCTQLFPSFPLVPAIVTVAAIVWFHVFLKTLGEVAWVSIFNAAMTLGLEVIVISCALSHPPDHKAETKLVNKDVLSLGGAFAGCAFAYGVHPVLPSVYRTMKNPGQYRPMIILSFLTVIALYLPMYVVGYAIYGDDVKSPIYATPGLDGLPVVSVMIALITAHVLMAYAIVINVPETALETAVDIEKKSSPVLWRIALRTCFVALTCLVAIVLQTKFPPFLDLIASLTSTCTQFIFPTLFYMKVTSKVGIRLPLMEWVFCVVIIVCAVIGSVFGAIGAVKELAGM